MRQCGQTLHKVSILSIYHLHYVEYIYEKPYKATVEICEILASSVCIDATLRALTCVCMCMHM